jgi:hypothetical protein
VLIFSVVGAVVYIAGVGVGVSVVNCWCCIVGVVVLVVGVVGVALLALCCWYVRVGSAWYVVSVVFVGVLLAWMLHNECMMDA